MKTIDQIKDCQAIELGYNRFRDLVINPKKDMAMYHLNLCIERSMREYASQALDSVAREWHLNKFRRGEGSFKTIDENNPFSKTRTKVKMENINPSYLKIGQPVWHKEIYNGREQMKIVGIREYEVELEGDYSGGTHNVCQRDWLPIEGLYFVDQRHLHEKLEEFTDWLANNWFIPADESLWRLDTKHPEYQRTIPEGKDLFSSEELVKMFTCGQGVS